MMAADTAFFHGDSPTRLSNPIVAIAATIFTSPNQIFQRKWSVGPVSYPQFREHLLVRAPIPHNLLPKIILESNC